LLLPRVSVYRNLTSLQLYNKRCDAIEGGIQLKQNKTENPRIMKKSGGVKVCGEGRCQKEKGLALGEQVDVNEHGQRGCHFGIGNCAKENGEGLQEVNSGRNKRRECQGIHQVTRLTYTKVQNLI